MKDSFVLYTKINDVVQELSNEQKGMLFQIILDYERTGEVPEIDDPVVKVAFIPIKRDLDINDEKYQKVSEGRAESGRKGGLAKSNNSKQNVAKRSKGKQNVAKVDFANQNIANVADNDNDNDNDNDLKDNNPPISPQGEWDYSRHTNVDNTKHILNTGLYENADFLKDHSRLWECIKTWMKYKDEKTPRKNNHYVGDTSIIILLNKFVEHCRGSGEEAVIEVVETSISSNYMGILWDKIKAPNNGIDWGSIK